MLFLNTMLLLGALGVSIPIIIHLLNRRSNRVIEWGAMEFLLQSLAIRNRRIQLEEALLMAARCLLVGLLALALARPFVPPGSSVPWLAVLPLILLAIVGLGVAAVLQNERKWRRRIFVASIVVLLLCAILIVFEKQLNLNRFGNRGARQDIALIIDGSTSMTMQSGGSSNFDRAIEEARLLIERAPRGHAFSLIIGGPTPSAKVLAPTTDRAALEAHLAEAKPLDGSMSTYHSLTLAALGLAQGHHPAKQIILLSDGQNVGWELGKPARWNFLRNAFKNLPTEPQVILRTMPLPETIRNVSLTDIAWSRDIVGVDRPVEVAVTIENTGDEAVTPGELTLRVGEAEYRSPSLGQLLPGARETVSFTHRFTEPGAHSVEAFLAVEDEIDQDNSRAAALNIAAGLKVLLVDGRPGPRFFDRASSFAALALAPIPDGSDDETGRAPAEPDPSLEGEPGEADEPVRFLVEPQVIPAPQILEMRDFSNFDAVILADVPRLPAESAEALARYVRDGGGLLVAPGQRALAEFYNAWNGPEGEALLPARFAEELIVPGEEDLVSPSLRTLSHPSLAKLSGEGDSDLASTLFHAYWPLTVPESMSLEASVGARLNNGDPMLISRHYGAGRITLLSSALDTSTGNLPTRHAFLPFVHELVYELADPSAYDLNLDPGWDLSLHLTGGGAMGIGQGLKASYFANDGKGEPNFVRIDPSVQFRWGSGSPAPGVSADNFRVEWKGSIRAPRKGSYKFSAEADDDLEVWIDGRSALKIQSQQRKAIRTVKLDARRWHDFRAVLRERGGDAHATLYWEGKDLPRQIVPASAFRAYGKEGDSSRASSGEAAQNLTIVGPDEQPRSAEIVSTTAGGLVRIQGDILSGLYHLKVPEDRRAEFASFLRSESDSIPFTVKRDPAESHFTPLNDSDYAFLESFVTLTRTATQEDLLKILTGAQFGQELWKYLALGAFFFLLLEIALSRWIARERQSGEEISIDFESNQAPSAGFKEQLERMRGAAG